MNELQKALVSNSAAAPPQNVLQALDDDTAHRRLAGAPHSIYEEVWHLAFWQDITLRWIAGVAAPYPESATEGFPPDTTESWDALRERFLDGTKLAAQAAGNADRLEIVVDCPSRADEPVRRMTVREQLESLAAHNAYHLGRIVLLRQVFGCWPPPAGGDTW